MINDIDHGLLMPAAAIAELVTSADDLLLQWCIDYRQLPRDPDSVLLKKCIAHFEKELDRPTAVGITWTTSYRQHQMIAEAFAAKRVNAPDSIVLTGFDDLTPLLKKILDASGSTVVTADAPRINSQIKTVALTDYSQEFCAAAHWAQQLLQNNLRADKPDISIGIIVPDLNQHREKVERTLQQVFEPQYILPRVRRYSPPFNISAGESLANQPIIASALQLLKLNNPYILLNDLLSILHSPFWSNDQEEITERIDAELHLRKIRWETLSTTDLRQGLADNSALRTRLNHFENEKRKQRNALYPSECLSNVQQQLQILGWPGTRRLDSVEYQQVAQFQRVLDQLISMDDLLGKITFQQALQHIQHLCQKTLYHAQTQDSPIQVLGILEGSGLHFDALWVCGMSEQNWPPLAKPHPLLPLALQMEHNMPHCSVAREQHYCENITRDLLNSAETIMVSFAETIDESKQQISSAFSDYTSITAEQLLGKPLSDQHPYLAHIAQQKPWLDTWEVIHDNHGPAFNQSKARGGQGLLKLQAQNPFDAFASYRLHARALEEPVPGLPKTERGILIHAALYYFWKNCQHNGVENYSALMNLRDTNRDTLIDKSVEFAFRRITHPALLNETFRAIEKIQLTKHLQRWLELEEQRSPFTVVALEKNIAYVLDGIELSLTIDRIDQLNDGSFLLMDYKTTSTALSSKQWLEQRPEEPQLPLYCLANTNTSGICFAQVNLNTIRFVAMGSHPDIPSLTEKKLSAAPAWEAQQLQWQQHLTQLMQEFREGLASVDYRNGKVPEYSEYLQILNRWPEKAFMDKLLQEKEKT